MPIFARGVAKTVAIGYESGGFGVPAPGPGQFLRRTQSDLNLSVAQLDSQEILPSQQMRDSRYGPRQVQGTLAGQLSPQSYKMLFEGLLRGTFMSGGVSPVVSDASATADGAGGLVITSPSANFTNGAIRVGDMMRMTTANAGINMRVTNFGSNAIGLQAIGGIPVAFGAGSPTQLYGVGKRLVVPQGPAQIDRSFTIEHYYSDVGTSELFTGLKVSGITLNVPASGFVTFQASLTGQNLTASNQQYFAAALPVSTTSSLTATTGKLMYNGVPFAYITGMNLQLMTQAQAVNTVGSNIAPAIFVSQITVRGSLTALMTNDTITQDFLNENEISLSMTMTTNPTGLADFVSIFMPRVKLTSSTKTDSPSAITRSYNFTALEYIAGNVVIDGTTVVVSDSQA